MPKQDERSLLHFFVQFLRIFKNGESKIPKTNDSREYVKVKETKPIYSLKSHLIDGGVAQLGEHLPCKQGVMGSNPIISTTRHGSGADL